MQLQTGFRGWGLGLKYKEGLAQLFSINAVSRNMKNVISPFLWVSNVVSLYLIFKSVRGTQARKPSSTVQIEQVIGCMVGVACNLFSQKRVSTYISEKYTNFFIRASIFFGGSVVLRFSRFQHFVMFLIFSKKLGSMSLSLSNMYLIYNIQQKAQF